MSVDRARLHFRIADRLQDALTDGEALMQFAISTSGGDIRADVVWASGERRAELKTTDEPLAPEICVEVVQDADAPSVRERREQYFDAGAEEVWICTPDGRIQFFGPDGEQDASARVPSFPSQVTP